MRLSPASLINGVHILTTSETHNPIPWQVIFTHSSGALCLPYRVLTATQIKTGCPESAQGDKDTFFLPPLRSAAILRGNLNYLILLPDPYRLLISFKTVTHNDVRRQHDRSLHAGQNAGYRHHFQNCQFRPGTGSAACLCARFRLLLLR